MCLSARHEVVVHRSPSSSSGKRGWRAARRAGQLGPLPGAGGGGDVAIGGVVVAVGGSVRRSSRSAAVQRVARCSLHCRSPRGVALWSLRGTRGDHWNRRRTVGPVEVLATGQTACVGIRRGGAASARPSHRRYSKSASGPRARNTAGRCSGADRGGGDGGRAGRDVLARGRAHGRDAKPSADGSARRSTSESIDFDGWLLSRRSSVPSGSPEDLMVTKSLV